MTMLQFFSQLLMIEILVLGFFFSALLYMILVLMDKRFSVNVLK